MIKAIYIDIDGTLLDFEACVEESMRCGLIENGIEYKEKKLSLVKIKLYTGRTHQIRVQFASRGTPLCGDRRYGAPKESGSAIALAAVLPAPIAEMTVAAPVTASPPA